MVNWTVFLDVSRSKTIEHGKNIPQMMPGASQKQITPQSMQCDDHGTLDFGDGQEGRVAYLYTIVEVPEPQLLYLSAGADWWMEWWVNGELMYATEQGNGKAPVTAEDHQFSIQLAAGSNLIAVRVSSGSAGWKLCLKEIEHLEPAADQGLAYRLDPSAIEMRPLTLRLKDLDYRLQQARKQFHIPGLAIAVVKKDELIFAQGYGFRDLDERLPVETDTLFAIGSVTKAFTATVIGQLVSQGKMDWDDPVKNYLPYFKLHPDAADTQVTIRDLLCHRTGYSRMGMLWAGGKTTQEEILKAAIKAKPLAPHRETFLYNNVMYLAAGACSEVAAGTDWHNLVQNSLLQQLGMHDTTTRYADVQADTRLAKGYVWDKDVQNQRQLPMRNIDNVSPAGSINSHVLDMAEWIKFQLSRDDYKIGRLLDPDQRAETRKPHISMHDNGSYGLGWMLRRWRGNRMVEHGGNIDGFTAQVAFLPSEEIGFVLLSNADASPLQGASADIVFGTLLGTHDPIYHPNIIPKDIAQQLATSYGTFIPDDVVIKLSGSTVYENEGVAGTAELIVASDGRFTWRHDLGQFGSLAKYVDRDSVHTTSTFYGLEQLIGRRAMVNRLDLPFWGLDKLRNAYSSCEVGDLIKEDSKELVPLVFNGPNLPRRVIYLDRNTGLIMKEDKMLEINSVEYPITIEYQNHQIFNGVTLPHRSIAYDMFGRRIVTEFVSVQSLDGFPSWNP